MKAKVIIENGQTAITLTPENNFETDIIEKVYNKRSGFEISTAFGVNYFYGKYSDHKIEISLNKIDLTPDQNHYINSH